MSRAAGEIPENGSDPAIPQPAHTRAKHRSTPTLDEVVTDAFVNAKLEEAWTESNPHAPEVRIGKPGSAKIEQGGWIIWNKKTGELEVVRVAAGSRDGLASIVGSRPEDNEIQEVVAWFHTHPNKVPEGYAADPSPADIVWQASEAKVPGIIETHEGRKLIPYA